MCISIHIYINIFINPLFLFIKGDTHYTSWFSALSKFTATFYRRFPTTELKGLLHFLLKQLSSGQSLDLLVLKELLGRMGGCDTLIEMSSEQLEGIRKYEYVILYV